MLDRLIWKHYITDMEAGQTLAGLLKPYRAAAIAEAVGRSRQAATAWRAGAQTPDVGSLPALATFLRMDLGELTAIVARSQAAA